MNDKSSTHLRRIAILGTGKMGSAIATRLFDAGFEIALWNRTRSRAEALGLGMVAETPAAAAGDADIIVSSLTSVLGSMRHVGPLGSAARLKLVANSMLADVVLAAAELQVAGENAGLDPDEVFWALRRLVPALEPRRGGFVEDRHVPTLFALRDLRKDLDLALALFGRSVAETPITRSACELIGAAAAMTPELDITAVARPYRRVRPSPTLQTAVASGATGKTE